MFCNKAAIVQQPLKRPQVPPILIKPIYQISWRPNQQYKSYPQTNTCLYIHTYKYRFSKFTQKTRCNLETLRPSSALSHSIFVWARTRTHHMNKKKFFWILLIYLIKSASVKLCVIWVNLVIFNAKSRRSLHQEAEQRWSTSFSSFSEDSDINSGK